jgi:hypothetical protein
LSNPSLKCKQRPARPDVNLKSWAHLRKVYMQVCSFLCTKCTSWFGQRFWSS